LLALVLTGASLGSSLATAEPAAPAATSGTCAAGAPEIPLAKEMASVGIMYNLAEHPKSVRAVAARLLDDAYKQTKANDSAKQCKDCKNGAQTRVIYRVGPTKFLPDAEQQAVCVSLAKQTKDRPFIWPDRSFKSISKVNDWIRTFSEGHGDEGKDLYARCSANCSPRYEFEIYPEGEGVRLQTRVQCGLARDASDDQYEVATSLHTVCKDEQKPAP